MPSASSAATADGRSGPPEALSSAGAWSAPTAPTVSCAAGSPVYLSQRALLQAIFPEHDPTLRQATPETVASLGLEDVRSYYAKVLRPDLTTIVVIGKVTTEQAKIVVEKYFGEWKATGAKPETDLPPVPRNQPKTTLVPDRSRVQDDVTLGQTFELTRQDADYYSLQLGMNVLSGAFYATRLYRDLRENTGLVYR